MKFEGTIFLPVTEIGVVGSGLIIEFPRYERVGKYTVHCIYYPGHLEMSSSRMYMYMIDMRVAWRLRKEEDMHQSGNKVEDHLGKQRSGTEALLENQITVVWNSKANTRIKTVVRT